MQSSTIRELFLDYFRSKEHLIMPSFPLIPQNDPTLLLVGAGMAPLKPFFTGEKKPPHPRLATCQKCVRTPDIDRVGLTGRHATFFEMLGNFSFGDYFKEEAIAWAWDLVLNGYRLPVERLWVSIYEEDEEAFNIWHRNIGVPSDRIVRLGKEDNFWEIGLGPCGPCSEIYIDLGEEAGCGSADCAVGCDCDRYLEIWNLVFTQFSRQVDGSLVELAQKNIDTGAGLERMAMALQGVSTIYETDMVRPLYKHFKNLADSARQNQEVPLRIITEHSRGTTFLIADGVIPSNEGRGYVLRRLLRRAVRYGRLLGIEGSFLTDAVTMVVDKMGDAYPELKERHDYIRQIVGLEERKFQETLAQGTEILEGFIEEIIKSEKKTLPGEKAFKLYDTYGFPLDLTAEILEEKGLSVDRDAFDSNLKVQQERARAAANANYGTGGDGKYKAAENLSTTFTGYDTLEQDSELLLILNNGKTINDAKTGEVAEFILDQTPFYAEAGGQIGDTGYLESENGKVRVKNTIFAPTGQIIHQGNVEEGKISTGEKITASVDVWRRDGICRSHTSTHLLHRALRNRLGDHVNQAGSLVAPDRLRFDFNHFAALNSDDLKFVEEEVNKMVLANVAVDVEETSIDKAREKGATALFADKYDENVRMVSAGDYTIELCGGTHVSATGKIGLFKIIAEEGIGSGLRRIEAITGMTSYRQTVERDDLIAAIAASLNTSEGRIKEKVEEYIAEHKQLHKQNQELKQTMAGFEVSTLITAVKEINGAKMLSAQVEADNPESLRIIMDKVKENLNSILVVLGAVSDGKVILVGSASPDLVKRGLQANKIIKQVAARVGGGGGGKPELAQAGGKDPTALPEALSAVEDMVREMLKA